MKRQAKVLIILAAFAFGVIAASHAAPKAEGKPKKEAAVKSPKQETKAESAKAAATAPATPEMSIEEAWKQAPTYKFGGSRAALTAIENQVRESYGSPDARAAVGKKLVDLLGSNATGEAKEFACRQLAIVGGDDAVPALSALLLGPDEKLAEYGRYALDRIPGKAADEALLAALDKTQKGTKVGVINSLGVRKVAAAVPKIAPLAGDSDSAIASAAMAALGKIGGKEAIDALAQAKAKAPKQLKPRISEAQLAAAAQLQAAGQAEQAAALYKELYGESEPKTIRAGAAQGLLAAGTAKEVPLAVELLKSGDPGLETVAVRFAREAKGEGIAKALAAELPQLPPASQAMLISALGDRGDAAAGPAVAEAAKSSDEAVRVAALGALAALGDASTVSLLAEAAAKSTGQEQTTARASLARIKDANADAALAQLAERLRVERTAKPGGAQTVTMMGGPGNVAPEVQIEAIKALAARGARNEVPALLTCAKDPDGKVRAEAWRALGALGREADLPAMAGLLASAAPEDRPDASKAAVAVAQTIPDPAKQTAPLLAVLAAAKDPGVKGALLGALARLGGEQALAAVHEAMKDSNEEVKDAAVRALADWPTADPADELLQIAKGSPNETQKVLALRGYVRMAGLADKTPADKKVKMFEEAMGLAARDDEKRLVLSGLSDVKSPAALKLVEPYLDNEGLKAEASAAAVKICAQTSNLPNDEVVATLQKALPNVKDAKLRKAGEDALNKAQGQPVEETKKKKRGTEKAAEAQKAVAAPEKAAAKEKAPKAEAKGGKGGKAKAAGEAGAGLGKNAPVQPPVDFIKDWVLSGPYMQEGKTGNDLFDVAFPPEDPKAKDVKWAPMKSPKAPAHMFYIDLKYELGGDNRVAYMKTNVFSPKEQKAQLALGSDDSIIAWLNGEKVFGKKVSRSLKPGADKAPITLKEGENTLMLKVTQDKGYWGAVAQITAPDGSKLEGLKFQAAAEEGAASAPVSAARPKEQPAGSKPAEQGGAKAVEFIKDWVIAGPFKEEGKTGTDLLDVAFPPEEQGAGNVAWHQMKSPKAPAHLFYIDLKYEIGGENCVAYLRTTIESPKAQKALLKLGADDGAVVWVNGERVLAQKAIKSLKADAQSAPITLKEGANTLLIKVAQDSGYWGVVANIVAPDGSKLEGLKAVAPAVAAAPPAPQEETRKPK